MGKEQRESAARTCSVRPQANRITDGLAWPVHILTHGQRGCWPASQLGSAPREQREVMKPLTLSMEAIRPKRILLVDDEAGLRQCLAELLGCEQYVVVEAENAVTALGLFAPAKFDLIITDYAMPEMNGGELAARVKRMAPSQPVMMITGCREALDNSEIQADAVFSKPFNGVDLLHAIAKLISSRPLLEGSG